jgi:CelD/BcsL family acetyltransferase involved in cellulose biosynthesis
MTLSLEFSALDSETGVPEYWHALYEEDPDASPFVSPQWCNAWLKHYGKTIESQLCTWRLAGQPVAVCLVVKRKGKWGKFSVSQVGVNTSLDFIEGSAYIEFNDIICSSANREQIRDSLAEFASNLDADEIHLSGATEGGMLDQLVPVNMQSSVEIDVRTAPFLDMSIAKTPADILNIFSANTRAQIRRTIKHFETLGNLTVSSPQDATMAIQFFEELMKMHQEHWTLRGKPGAFSSNYLSGFHRELIVNSFNQRICRLFKISAGNVTLGYIYGFERFKRFYFYQSGIDYNVEKNLKPGLLAHFSAIQTLHTLGFAEYDFLAGSSQYKRSISNKERVLHWKVFRKNSAKMHCLVQLAKIKRKFVSH